MDLNAFRSVFEPMGKEIIKTLQEIQKTVIEIRANVAHIRERVESLEKTTR